MERAVQIGALVWAVVGLAVATSSLANVDAGAVVAVGVASVAFPLCAVVAAVAIARGRLRVAGVFLLLSAATPTYFAWVVNLPAVVVGVGLIVAPRVHTRRAAA